MISPKNWCLAALVLASLSFTLRHHGWSNYDQTRVMDFTATILESKYENPHATASVKHEDKTWTVVLAPVSRLSDRGVSANMIKKGRSMRIVGYPHKTVAGEMRAERIFINNKKYELR